MIDRRGTTREKSRHRSQPEIQRGKRQAKGRYPPRGSLDRHHDNTASHHDATNADEHGHSQSTDHQPAGGAAVAEMRVARLDRLAAWCPRGRFGYAAASGASGCVGFQAGWAAARISGRTWVARAWCGTPGGLAMVVALLVLSVLSGGGVAVAVVGAAPGSSADLVAAAAAAAAVGVLASA